MKINILVAQHKNTYLIKSEILKPITCGEYKEKNKLSDSDGDNISYLNDKYCELTTQYWAWKNLNSDYYGFFHYRRFLSFNENQKNNEYQYTYMDDFFIKETKLNDENIRNVVEKYDIVVPAPMIFYEGIYHQYKFSNNHDIKDLENIFNIVLQKHPNFKKIIKNVKKSKEFYPCNMYIMKKEIFFNYCEWLFPILKEFDENYDYNYKNLYSNRIIGFLAERLFNVYFRYIKKNYKNIKIKILPLTIIKNNDNPYPIQQKKDSIPVVLACDDNYAKYAILLIEEILANNKKNKFYEFFIMSNNISEIWCKRIKSIENTNKNILIQITDGNRFIQGKNLKEHFHVNKTTYFRLGILEYLKNFNKVIYLDCDTLVNDDLYNLFSIDLGEKALGAVIDTVHSSSYWDKKSMQFQNCNNIGIKNIWEYFNSGVLLMDIQKMNIISSFNELIKDCEEKKYYWQDQDALNFTFQGHFKFLDNKWNCFSHDHIYEINAPIDIYQNYLKALENPSIIHYAGRNIPTFSSHTWLEEYFWKYAKKSKFYEEILKDMSPKQISIPEKKWRNWNIKNKIKDMIKSNTFLLKISISIYKHFKK